MQMLFCLRYTQRRRSFAKKSSLRRFHFEATALLWTLSQPDSWRMGAASSSSLRCSLLTLSFHREVAAGTYDLFVIRRCCVSLYYIGRFVRCFSAKSLELFVNINLYLATNERYLVNVCILCAFTKVQQFNNISTAFLPNEISLFLIAARYKKKPSPLIVRVESSFQYW